MPRAKPKIEVSFSLDASGILTVSAKELSSGASGNSITITSKGSLSPLSLPPFLLLFSYPLLDRLSEAEIKRMLAMAEEFAEMDKRAKEVLEWRNGLEAYAFNVKNKIDEAEVKEMITDEEKAKLEEAARKAIDFVDEASNDLELIKQHQKVSFFFFLFSFFFFLFSFFFFLFSFFFFLFSFFWNLIFCLFKNLIGH